MIGIIGAMQVEVESLIADMEETETATVGANTFYRGKINGAETVVVQCGIGKVAAAVAAQTMILLYHPDLLLNTGVGGTLTPELSVGDIAVSTSAVEHDMDTSPIGDPVGFLSGLNKVFLEADEKAGTLLLDLSAKLGLNAKRGIIASGDQFIADPAVKAKIVKNFGASVCEMEGAAIAHAACLNGTPFVIVRAISDSADGSSHVDFPTFVASAAKNSYRLVREFLNVYR